MISVSQCTNFRIIYCRVESDEDNSKTSLSGSGCQNQIEAAFVYLGDKDIPVYATEIKELSNIDIARLLLDPAEDKVAIKPPKFSSLIRRRLVFVTQMTGKQMVLEFLKMMEVMSLRITRTRIQKSASFPKQNQKTVNAQQFFSRGRTGRTLNIPISAEELMKY